MKMHDVVFERNIIVTLFLCQWIKLQRTVLFFDPIGTNFEIENQQFFVQNWDLL
jgi:hypothetical protein